MNRASTEDANTVAQVTSDYINITTYNCISGGDNENTDNVIKRSLYQIKIFELDTYNWFEREARSVSILVPLFLLYGLSSV